MEVLRAGEVRDARAAGGVGARWQVDQRERFDDGGRGRQAGRGQVRIRQRRNASRLDHRIDARRLSGVVAGAAAQRQVGRLAADPAVLREEICHAADHVGGAVDEVDSSVAVVVDRVMPDTARHELRHPDRARVRAAQHGQVAAAVAAHAERFGQLLAEKRRPVAFPVRIVERERGQRVDHAEVAGVAAVDRLDAEDADDDLGRHAEVAFGPREQRVVVLPEAEARGKADWLDEARAVDGPVATHAGRRRRHHQPRRGRAVADVGEEPPQCVAVETLTRDEVVDVVEDVHPLRVVGRRQPNGSRRDRGAR